MGRMTNEQVLKMARRAAAHVAAGVEAVEMNAATFEKLMWEVLLLRKRETDRAASTAEKFPSATQVLEGTIPQHIEPEHDRTQVIGSNYASRTCPGTIKAVRERRDSDRFSLPGDSQ
jgi:hypothetical protein